MSVRDTSGILVTFSGLPYTTSNFFLDNGMANLAGALIDGGHNVLILDYNTPTVLEYVFTKDIRKGLTSVSDLINSGNMMNHVKANQIYENIQAEIDKLMGSYNEYLFNDIATKIQQRNANYVGFKLWLGRGIKSTIYIAERLKQQFPNLKIYGGGPAATLFTNQVFNLTDVFDAVTIGEGEWNICDIAEHSIGKRKLESIPNLAHKEGSRIVFTPQHENYSLNQLPNPVYDKDVYPDAHVSNQKIRIVTMDESRGCNNKCAFCTHGVIGGRPVRKMDAERVVEQFAKHTKTLGTHVFNLGGSCVPDSLINDITHITKEKNIEIIFNCFTSAEKLNTDRLDKYRDGGLFSVFYGIESLDKNILRNDYLKAFNPDTVANAIKQSLDSGIYVTGSIIYPAPRETFKSTFRTRNLLADMFENKPNGSVVVFYPGLMPHSTWSEKPEKFAIECSDIEKHFEDLINCEVRHFLPPSLWETYNYSMNGKSQAKLAQLSNIFARSLERKNVTINAMGDSAMLAFMLEKSASEFGQMLGDMFLMGDGSGLSELIEEINKGICRKPPKRPENWFPRS